MKKPLLIKSLFLSTTLLAAEQLEMEVNPCLRNLIMRKLTPQGSVAGWEECTKGCRNTKEEFLVTPSEEGFLEKGDPWLSKVFEHLLNKIRAGHVNILSTRAGVCKDLQSEWSWLIPDSLGSGRWSWWTWYAMLIIRIFTESNRKTLKNFKKGVTSVYSKERGRS